MLILCSFYENMPYCKIVSSQTKKRFHKTWSEIVHYHFEEAYFCGLLGGHMLISEIQQRILSLIFGFMFSIFAKAFWKPIRFSQSSVDIVRKICHKLSPMTSS